MADGNPFWFLAKEDQFYGYIRTYSLKGASGPFSDLSSAKDEAKRFYIAKLAEISHEMQGVCDRAALRSDQGSYDELVADFGIYSRRMSKLLASLSAASFPPRATRYLKLDLNEAKGLLEQWAHEAKIFQIKDRR